MESLRSSTAAALASATVMTGPGMCLETWVCGTQAPKASDESPKAKSVAFMQQSPSGPIGGL